MYYLIILTCLLFSGISQAGEMWTKYSLPDTINCITSYKDYIWTGTENGVVRMNRNDGSLIRFTAENDRLAEKYINYLLTDKDGELFAGSIDGQTGFTSGKHSYHGGVSLYDGVSWKIFKKGMDGLSGNDIKGIGIDDNSRVWIALNDIYYSGTGYPYDYFVSRHVIQYYENSLWRTKTAFAESVQAFGNWYLDGNDITSFTVADSSFYSYTHLEDDSYSCPININDIIESTVNYEGIPFPSWISNIKFENIQNGKRIWVNNYSPKVDESIYNIIYGNFYDLYTQNNNSTVLTWTVLKPPTQEFTHYSTPLIIDQSNNKWFVDRNESNNKYLIKYDDVNYLPFTCPSWTDSTEITCLYADEKGFIWIGTQKDGLWRFDANNVTSVETTQQTPASFTLSTAYPNPFNASTTINFTLNMPGKVNLAVYNLAGQKVKELATGNYSAGSHNLVWDGRDDYGNAVSSGVYLTRMESGGVSKVVRMALVK